MKAKKVRRRLEESFAGGRIVSVVRHAFEIAMTDGFVLALTDEWVVIHELTNGVYLDQLVMLRLEDVTQVWFRDDDAYHRAIAALGAELSTFECADDIDVIGLIEAASTRAAIFAIHMEVLRGEPFAIGRLIKLGRKRLTMHYVGRDGEWAPEVERWRYRDVTRIEVGGRYLDALNRFAGPYPESAEPDGRHPRSGCARDCEDVWSRNPAHYRAVGEVLRSRPN